jgi:hypothetical protein
LHIFISRDDHATARKDNQFIFTSLERQSPVESVTEQSKNAIDRSLSDIDSAAGGKALCRD